jgi:hypothetical protein
MHDSTTDLGPVPEDSGPAGPSPTSTGREPRATLSERFEDSRVGAWVISAVIVVILGVQVVWSIPDSPIRRGLMPIVKPANVLNVNIPWEMFSGTPNPRIEDFEARVTMADGSTRTWKVLPRSPLEKMFVPNRWDLMREQAMRQQDGRRDFAHWIVREVTQPSERPVKVELLFHYKVLVKPGQSTTGQSGTRVLYEEELTGRP